MSVNGHHRVISPLTLILASYKELGSVQTTIMDQNTNRTSGGILRVMDVSARTLSLSPVGTCDWTIYHIDKYKCIFIVYIHKHYINHDLSIVIYIIYIIMYILYTHISRLCDMHGIPTHRSLPFNFNGHDASSSEACAVSNRCWRLAATTETGKSSNGRRIFWRNGVHERLWTAGTA